MPGEPKTFKKNCGQVLGGCLGIILLGAIVGFLMNREKNAWTGLFYDTPGSTYTSTVKKNLKSVDACRTWAQKEADKRNLADGAWDYDCGTGCEIESTPADRSQNLSHYVCAETTK